MYFLESIQIQKSVLKSNFYTLKRSYLKRHLGEPLKFLDPAPNFTKLSG